MRELNSALSHFEESHREELQGNLDSSQRKLTRAKLERALAEEQEAHRATRRQLDLYKLAAAESTTKSATKSSSKEGKRNQVFSQSLHYVLLLSISLWFSFVALLSVMRSQV